MPTGLSMRNAFPKTTLQGLLPSQANWKTRFCTFSKQASRPTGQDRNALTQPMRGCKIEISNLAGGEITMQWRLTR